MLDVAKIADYIGKPAVWTYTDYHGQGFGRAVTVIGERRIVKRRPESFFGDKVTVYVIVQTRDGKRHRVKPHNVITNRGEAMWWHPRAAREAFGE